MDAMTRLWRRTLQMVGIARGTTAVTDGGVIRTVQLMHTSLAAQADSVPFVQQYGFASRPHPGCDHLTVSLGGNFGRMVVVGTNDQRYRMALVEGEVGIHDDLKQSLHLLRTGITWTDQFLNSITSSTTGFVLADKFGNKIVTGANGVIITSCTGVVSSPGDFVADAGPAQVSLVHHVQTNGGGTGDSGPPAPGT